MDYESYKKKLWNVSSLGGVAFLKPHVRRGILPKMLEEIIDTRLMVKRSMKLYNQVSKKNPGFKAFFLICVWENFDNRK